jgi:thiamine pyrophosphokinase
MRKTIAILAAGDFPKKDGPAWRILTTADVVVCCDSAADAYLGKFGREPDFVVGDCDSVKGRFRNIVRVAEQETNDLEKAVLFCKSKGWRHPVILGATGRREDHTIGNVFRAMDLGLKVVTDYGTFVPFCGSKSFKSRKGASISIFAADPATKMTSKGLEWPLDDVSFKNLYCATLNRATCGKVVLSSDRPVCLYFGP